MVAQCHTCVVEQDRIAVRLVQIPNGELVI